MSIRARELEQQERFEAQAAGLCMFDGGSGGNSSSSSSNTTTNTINTDKRQVVDTGSVGVSSDSSTVNVSVLDGDAFKNAVDLAKSQNDAFSKSLVQVLGLASDALTVSKASAATVGQAYQNSQDAMTGTRQIAAVGLVVAGIVAMGMVLK